jgi:hypothetical protein
MFQDVEVSYMVMGSSMTTCFMLLILAVVVAREIVVGHSLYNTVDYLLLTLQIFIDLTF